MKKDKIDLYVYSFYRFIDLKNIKLIKSKLDKFFFKKKLKGTILLSLEVSMHQLLDQYMISRKV